MSTGPTSSHAVTATFTPPPVEVSTSANAAGHHRPRGSRSPRCTHSSSHGSAALASSVIEVRPMYVDDPRVQHVEQAAGEVRGPARAPDERVEEPHHPPPGEGERDPDPEPARHPAGSPSRSPSAKNGPIGQR